MHVRSPADLVNGNCYIELQGLVPNVVVQVKLEGFSQTGSIKVKSARHMLNGFERAGRLRPGSRVIESSSGNLGVALAMICAARGYRFTCVTDPNISPASIRMIRAYGAEVIVVQQRDVNGGFLGTRIELIRKMLHDDPSLVWVNQYENTDNVDAHVCTTGSELLSAFPSPDFVFVGAGTTGTLGGVSIALRRHCPQARLVAVDSTGSVTFGGIAGKRHLPGLGTSASPPIRRFSSFDELVMVREIEAIRMCRRLAAQGLLLGASSGTVLAGVEALSHSISPGSVVVAISPDFGDRYLDSVYDDDWVATRFPETAFIKPENLVSVEAYSRIT